MAKTQADQSAKKAKRTKMKKSVPHGRIYIQSTYNNTIISITDQQGDVLTWLSSGSLGFKGPKKATPYAASLIIRKLFERIKDVGLRQVDIFVKGVGSGRESAIRAIAQQGVSITMIKDVTPVAHNGTRPPKVRRV
jgi:small subunit ribosomal protein S11